MSALLDIANPEGLSVSRNAKRSRITLLACLGMIAVVATTVPFSARPLPALTDYVVGSAITLIITDGLTAALLIVQFLPAPSVPQLFLVAAYVATAFGALFHMLLFPYTPGQLPWFGGPTSPTWIWQFSHFAFPALVLAYAITDQVWPQWKSRRPQRDVASTLGLTGGGVAIILFVTTSGLQALPPLLSAQFSITAVWIACAGLTLVFSLTAVVVLLAQRGGVTLLQLGLIIALTANIGDLVLTTTSLARYALGWYGGRLFALLSSSALLMLFIAELSRLQRSLVRAHADLSAVNAGLEVRVAERTAELRHSLAERDLLLREVYHRVKNNLQVVDGLLGMQGARLADAEAKAALVDMRRRVHALSLVHQQLMSSHNLSSFDVRPFLQELTGNLAHGGSEKSGVSIETSAESHTVNLDFAIPLGLLITELVTNALKHAFPEGKGMVSIEMRHIAVDRAALIVADNGVGSTTEPGEGGFGQRIIRGLVRQLGGDMTVTQSAGTRVAVQMPLPVLP